MPVPTVSVTRLPYSLSDIPIEEIFFGLSVTSALEAGQLREGKNTGLMKLLMSPSFLGETNE
jgi:hypothetical protein